MVVFVNSKYEFQKRMWVKTNIQNTYIHDWGICFCFSYVKDPHLLLFCLHLDFIVFGRFFDLVLQTVLGMFELVYIFLNYICISKCICCIFIEVLSNRYVTSMKNAQESIINYIFTNTVTNSSYLLTLQLFKSISFRFNIFKRR